jgi:hypothetical protein
MGQVMSVLTDENVSLEQPYHRFYRSLHFLEGDASYDNESSGPYGNLYVSTPGHYMVWRGRAIGQS